jgi:hypothetical protein
MKRISFALVTVCLLFSSYSFSQGDSKLTDAYKQVEQQFASLKINTSPSNNYFLYTESMGTNARDVLINDNLKSGVFGSSDYCFVILYKPSEELENSIRGLVPSKNIILITNSKLFSVMKNALNATKDLYLLKFDASRRVNIAAKLAG